MKNKFYNQPWFMWLMLIFIAPVGIFLIWKNKKFSKKARSIISGVFALWFILFVVTANSPTDSKTTSVNGKSIATTTDTKKKDETKKTQSNANTTKPTNASSSSSNNNTSPVNGQIKIHYINVGQGDSELIQCNGQNMLIDTGTNASTNSLMSYLKAQNISKIDYLVLTHPHEDHIGGADAVINAFNIGTVYMPKVTDTTKTFEDVVVAMNSKGLKASQPAPGTTFKLGDANCIILGPIDTNSKDLNTYSIVVKVTFGNNKFLFTGDAQASNEEDMIAKGYDLSADVLKVGHHGSRTSTSDDFLAKVNPKYAVISCGKGNDYGHPHQETMDKLKAKGIKVYRTDECGTIVCTSDGENITFSCNPGDYAYGSSGSSSSSSSSSGSTGGTTPTPPPSPTPSTTFSASVDNPTPADNTQIHVSVSGPGGTFTAVCHYKSKNTTYNGTVGSPLSIDIGGAAKGFTVIIEITINYNGQIYTTQTSFTPH